MKIVPAPLAGLFVVEIESHSDARGFFARSFCESEFAQHGLETGFPQHSISFNAESGTLRGMHYQAAPHCEAKLVRCTQGSIFDVVVDLRPASVTRGKWFALELSADNHRAIYIPHGFAHGFQTLTGDSEVLYMISCSYVPDAARGIVWNDPEVAIDWPLPVNRISSRDAALPLLAEI